MRLCVPKSDIITSRGNEHALVTSPRMVSSEDQQPSFKIEDRMIEDIALALGARNAFYRSIGQPKTETTPQNYKYVNV